MQGLKFNSKAVLLLIAGLICLSQIEGYTPLSCVSDEVWEKVTPYFLPENHEAKAILDGIFSSRAILSLKSMKESGFVDPKPRKWTHVIVCTHPNLPGYIIKTYLDSQRYFNQIPEHEHWIKRIKGVRLIEKEIAKQGWQTLFKTPKKWIYPLPQNPSPPKEFMRKNFILIEEDMHLTDKKTNEALWFSDLVNAQFLDHFYCLLEELGLHDCAKPDNAPFSIDGRVAFIDTEDHQNWPVTYSKLTPFLSPEMKKYWKQLIKTKKTSEHPAHGKQ